MTFPGCVNNFVKKLSGVARLNILKIKAINALVKLKQSRKTESTQMIYKQLQVTACYLFCDAFMIF